MNFAFEQTQHDRAAHLRRDDKWRAAGVQVMVVGGEHLASHGGKGIRWMPVWFTTGSGVWCDPFYCYSVGTGESYDQWDVNAALIIKM